jgi:hypothetical protein
MDPPSSTGGKIFATVITVGFLMALLGLFVANLSGYNGALDSMIGVGRLDEETKFWLTRALSLGLFLLFLPFAIKNIRSTWQR